MFGWADFYTRKQRTKTVSEKIVLLSWLPRHSMSGVVQQTEELPDFWFWAKHFRNATREKLCQGMLFWTSGLDDDHQFGGGDDDDDDDDDAVFLPKRLCICPHCFVRFYQTCKEFGFYQTCEVPSECQSKKDMWHWKYFFIDCLAIFHILCQPSHLFEGQAQFPNPPRVCCDLMDALEVSKFQPSLWDDHDLQLTAM